MVALGYLQIPNQQVLLRDNSVNVGFCQAGDVTTVNDFRWGLGCAPS